MPTIDIIIRNKTASAVNPPCIVCGNSDYNVKFDFDDEWQAHNNKIGVFAYNRCGEWQSEKVLFEGDTCPVPALHGVRSVWIGVTAGDVRTSTPADVPCRMGATDFSDTTEKPSADIWGQILDKLDELQTEIDEIKEGEVWEKICQVTTSENVSFVYQPFGGNYKKIRAIFWGNPLPHVRYGYTRIRKLYPEAEISRIYLTHHSLPQESIRLSANLAHPRTLRLTALIIDTADDAPSHENGNQTPYMLDGVTIFLIIMLMTPTLKIYRKV